MTANWNVSYKLQEMYMSKIIILVGSVRKGGNTELVHS